MLPLFCLEHPACRKRVSAFFLRNGIKLHQGCQGDFSGKDEHYLLMVQYYTEIAAVFLPDFLISFKLSGFCGFRLSERSSSYIIQLHAASVKIRRCEEWRTRFPMRASIVVLVNRNAHRSASAKAKPSSKSKRTSALIAARVPMCARWALPRRSNLPDCAVSNGAFFMP